MFKTGDIIKSTSNLTKWKIEGLVGDVAIISCAEPGNEMTHTMHIDTVERCYEMVKAYIKPWVPNKGDMYYLADISLNDGYYISYWDGDDIDIWRLEHGMVFKEEDDAVTRAREILVKIK